MKIVIFITECTVVRKILKYLDLWDCSPPAPIKSFAHEELVYEPSADGWPGGEEPLTVMQ